MSYGQYSAEHREERSNPLSYSEKAGKRTKRQVYPTDEIPHLWMVKSQQSARNPGGNLFFEHEVIYSYGHHFPIARHVENGRKGKQAASAVLFTTGRYSVTTSKHVGMVRGAIPESVAVFEVPDVEGRYSKGIDHERNLKHYVEEVAEKVLKAARARSSYSIESNLREAAEQRAQCLGYCKFFGLKVPKLVEVPKLDAAELAEIRRKEKERIAAKAKREKVAREAAYQKQIQEWMTAHLDYRARWDGTVADAEKLAKEFREREDCELIERWAAGKGSAYLPHRFETMLRIVDGEVETSLGARFPVSHARRGLALIESVMSRGEDWQRNGHTCHLGHYQIDRIEANGTVHAGCHVVTWKAIERIREQLLSA